MYSPSVRGNGVRVKRYYELLLLFTIIAMQIRLPLSNRPHECPPEESIMTVTAEPGGGNLQLHNTSGQGFPPEAAMFSFTPGENSSR